MPAAFSPDLAVLATVFVSVACNTGPAASGSAEAGAASSRAAVRPLVTGPVQPSTPPPPAFTGTLTVDRVVSAGGVLHGMEPYGSAYGKLVGLLGAPIKTVSKTHALVGKNQDQYQWAAMNGHTCASYFAIQNPDVLGGPGMLSEDLGGKKVDMPVKVTASDWNEHNRLKQQWDAYGECVAVLGQKPGLPPDDPRGAGPKAKVTMRELARGLETAPGKWIGKMVTVSGTYEGISSGTSMMIGTAGDPAAKKVLLCKVPKGETPPEQKAPKAPVTVTGKVNDPRSWGEENADVFDCRLLR